MNENDGGVTVPSVRDSTSVEGAADEILIGNFGGEIEKQVEEGEFVGGDEEEVMVEVVVLDEVVDHSNQVWDALGENGVGNVEQVEDVSNVVLDGDAKNLGTEMEIDVSEVNSGPVNKEAQNLAENVVGNVKKDELVVDEESLDVGEKLGKDESDVVLDGEGKNLGSEMEIDTSEVNLVPVNKEAHNLAEDVVENVKDEESLDVGERLSKDESDLVLDGEEKKLGTEIEIDAADINSGPVSKEVLNLAEEVSATESVGVIYKGLVEEGEIGTDSGDGEGNFQDYVTSGQDAAVNEARDLCSSKMEESLTSHTQIVSEEVCDTVVVDKNLAPPEVDQSSTLESISEETDKGVMDANVENVDPQAQVVEGEIDVMNKQGGLHLDHGVQETETDPVAGNLSSLIENQGLNVKESGAETEVVRVSDSNSSNSIGEAPNNDSLSLVDGVVGEVKTECVDKGSIVESDKVATVPSVAIDTEISVSVPPPHHADADEHLAKTENKEVESSVPNIDNTENKEVKSSKVDVAIPSDDQTHYAIASEVTTTESKVLNSLAEVPITSNIDSFIAPSKDFENVKCEKEIIPESNIEEAFADGGDDAGVDIDEVMNWKDEVPENNTFSGTLSDLEEDTHLKLNVEGSSEIGVAQADLKSSDELIHTADGSDVVLMELEKTKFEAQEETNGIDVDYEPMELDSLKGDLSLSEVGENANTGQTDLGITEENVLVAIEEKQEIVLQQDGTHILEVYHGTDEILNKEASVVVQSGKVAGDDGGNSENTVNLHVTECRDDGGDSTGIGSILGHKVEEGYPDGEQEREQEPETQEAEILISIDEELPENEADFSVSDLVWGKVKSHPWWPGQIFDPADASEKALKYHKKDSFLVAYFGDRTFAWNDATDLKPFMTHFSQVQKQGNSDTFRHAVSCALEEVSRRVELGLTCSCIPQDSYDKIKYQVVENTGIKQESSIRYGADKTDALSSFEPEKLLDYVRTLAQSPYDGTDQLELVIAKAQLSSFSRYKGHPPLPEFQYSGELLESDDTLELNEANEEVLVDESSSQKRKFTMMDSGYPNKKEKNMSDSMVDSPSSTDGEDGLDDKSTSKSVSTAGKKQRAIESFPKPSFKIGECIRRAASQLTGSPSILKGSNEKFLKIDGDDNEPTGFEVSLQTSGTDPRGRMNISPDQSSVYEMLSQLHLAAQDPMKGYSFLSTIIPFFTSYRTSVLSKARRQNSSTGRPGTARKRKASNDANNTPEEFEFDDVSDSYWTDRIIQNYSEEQLLQDGQNGGAPLQPMVLEPKKQVKSSVRKTNSRKRYSSSKYETKTEEPIEHVDRRKLDLPTELVLNFAVGVSVPPEMYLNKTFRRFGPLMESETEVDRQGSRARVVFKKCSDAEVAYSSAGKFNIFGSKVVNYELNYTPLVSYKPLPLPTLEAPEGAT